MSTSDLNTGIDFYEIAVITRTKDRVYMLDRAADGLLRQSYRNFVWVIVNDGGEAEPVDKVAARYQDAGMPVIVIHNEKNIGMEAASNRGIKKSQSKYIHIHDDDDTIERTFYEKMISRLEVSECKGVTCNINEIHEDVRGNKITILSSLKWDTGVPSISRMVCINRFVPISFLYLRSVHDDIGLYDESLKVCGDWEFYLRFLRKFDIDKVVDYLANYHIRELSDDEAAINSVKKQFDHQYHDMLIRNRLIREELNRGDFGYAGLITLGAQMWDTETKLYGIEQKGREAFELKDRVLRKLNGNFFLRLMRKVARI
ncbi:glycosyltransferase family A protein [Brucella gallinifaecis]|uniref:Glycosyltransferase family 2 protein n=1 Tax=Brucella gallinifaecis TaxID=215590 RepID=A0A502BTJ3_9HYPH|nr:glycosyltransferase family A protein [Brucella gallinifaecis]TPF77177.1 glycosyltransferase family 2 protein [Brucella gallinifaecis]